MFKTLFAALLALCAAAALAAGVEINKADQALLDSVKGIGPSLSSKMIAERKKAPFKNWDDLIERVQGVGPGNAARFSAAGLTVNDTPYRGAAPAAKPVSNAPAPKAATATK